MLYYFCFSICLFMVFLQSDGGNQYLSFTQTVTGFPFRNTSLPFGTRVDDLVARLTLDEMVELMSKGGGGGDGGPVQHIARLGIDPYWWGTECIHGDASGTATSFPQSIALAAAFDPSLIYHVAEAISTEVRAKNNDFVRRKIYSSHTGLHCFSPVINIMRHPLWGRNQETYGEDPYLSGVYAANFVRGLIGTQPRYYRANAVCKHFDAYGGPEDKPESRLSFNAVVTERDLQLTYLPAFRACIEAGALGIMCSYNSVNGVPACANRKLLTGILRDSWNFSGFVISDSGALEFIVFNHRYIQNIEAAAVAIAEAGVNLELHPGGQFFKRGIYDWLKPAVDEGKLSQEVIVERVKPLLYARMRLGEFDPPDDNPYTRLNLSEVNSPQHRALATLAAMKSIVLLENKPGLLPITDKLETVAVVGPFSNNSIQQTGSYSPDLDPRYVSTPVTGLSHLADRILVAEGCHDPTCLDYKPTLVVEAARQADVTFVCIGTGTAVETEGRDRVTMSLPGSQATLLLDVLNNAGGAVVVLIFSGGPLDIRLAQHPAVAAVLHCSLPGQATGVALYNVLTMQTAEANPAGRLPFTWYSSDEQIPSMTDYRMTNRTYRYLYGDAKYPFGYGLSYTQFLYTNLSVTPMKVKAGNNVTLNFNITNTGKWDGAEVYEVYISWLNATVQTPRYQLVNFNRTLVHHGQTVPVTCNITGQQMAVWIEGKGFVIEPGEIVVYVGGQLPNQKTKVNSNILTAIFSIFS